MFLENGYIDSTSDKHITRQMPCCCCCFFIIEYIDLAEPKSGTPQLFFRNAVTNENNRTCM